MRHHADRKTTALLGLPLFSAANPRDLRELAAAGDEVALPAGRLLQRAGRAPSECLLLLEGHAEVRAGVAVVATLGPGQLVAASDALDGDDAAFDVVAATDVVALVLTPARLRALVETNHIVRAAVFRQLAARARQLDRTLATA